MAQEPPKTTNEDLEGIPQVERELAQLPEYQGETDETEGEFDNDRLVRDTNALHVLKGALPERDYMNLVGSANVAASMSSFSQIDAAMGPMINALAAKAESPGAAKRNAAYNVALGRRTEEEGEISSTAPTRRGVLTKNWGKEMSGETRTLENIGKSIEHNEVPVSVGGRGQKQYQLAEKNQIAKYDADLRSVLRMHFDKEHPPVGGNLTAAWEKFRDGGTAGDFLRAYAQNPPNPTEFCTRDIVFIRLVLQSNALHHNADMYTRGACYKIRGSFLNAVEKAAGSSLTQLSKAESVVYNIRELQALVNVHGSDENVRRYKRNLEYLDAIDECRKSVLKNYDGLGKDETTIMGNAMELRSVLPVMEGLFGKHGAKEGRMRKAVHKLVDNIAVGYEKPANALKKNFETLYGKDFVQILGEDFSAFIESNMTPNDKEERIRTLIGIHTQKIDILERALGLEPRTLGKAYMDNQAPRDEKDAVNKLLGEIKTGTLITGGVSLGMSVGVGILSNIPATAPFAWIPAAVLTGINVFNQVRSAYSAVKELMPDNAKFLDIMKKISWGRVAKNSLIASAPVLLACVPLAGTALVEAGGFGANLGSQVLKVFPTMQKALSLGLAAKGFLQTWHSARIKGLRTLKGDSKKDAIRKNAKAIGLSAGASVLNFVVAMLTGQVGNMFAGNVATGINDTVKGQGELLSNIGNAFKQTGTDIADAVRGSGLGIIAGRIAAKMGWTQPDGGMDPIAPIQTQDSGMGVNPADDVTAGKQVNSAAGDQDSSVHAVADGNRHGPTNAHKPAEFKPDAENDDVLKGDKYKANEFLRYKGEAQNESRIGEMSAAAGLATAVLAKDAFQRDQIITDKYNNIQYKYDYDKVFDAARPMFKELAKKLQETNYGISKNIADIATEIREDNFSPAHLRTLALALQKDDVQEIYGNPKRLGEMKELGGFLAFHKLLRDYDWTNNANEFTKAHKAEQEAQEAIREKQALISRAQEAGQRTEQIEKQLMEMQAQEVAAAQKMKEEAPLALKAFIEKFASGVMQEAAEELEQEKQRAQEAKAKEAAEALKQAEALRQEEEQKKTLIGKAASMLHKIGDKVVGIAIGSDKNFVNACNTINASEETNIDGLDDLSPIANAPAQEDRVPDTISPFMRILQTSPSAQRTAPTYGESLQNIPYPAYAPTYEAGRGL